MTLSVTSIPGLLLMPTSYLLGLFLGALANIMSNVGKGLQKRHALVLLQGRKAWRVEHRRDLALWSVGTFMTSAVPLPVVFAIALTESSSSVAALTGVGLAALVGFSVYVLGERVSAIDWYGIFFVVVGTSLLGVLGKGEVSRLASPLNLALSVYGFIAFLIAFCVMGHRVKRLYGIAYGSLAGALAGSSMFLMDGAFAMLGKEWSAILFSPWPYLALLSGTGSQVAINLGFFRARALEVVPAYNSLLILTPVLHEALVFKSYPTPVKFGLFAFILCGVICLSLGSARRLASAPIVPPTTVPEHG